MSKFVDLTGQRFGRLTVVSRAENDKRGSARWLCMCDCGKTCIVLASNLMKGHTKSCGCLNLESTVKRSRTHGGRQTRLYRIWCAMKYRCNNPSATRYANYGGRGIKVCAEWERSFTAFQKWALKNGYSDSLSIDRIDSDIGYCPENCRWADATTQSRNRDFCKRLIFRGKNQPVSVWADETGIPAKVIYGRLDAGWPIERALTEPVKKKK